LARGTIDLLKWSLAQEPGPMLIRDVLLAEGFGAFYYDDQAAIAAGAEHDGFTYRGEPLTRGFDAVRMPARSLGIGLLLEDGGVAWGDMMTVQYSGAGGREPVFDPKAARALVQDVVARSLVGCAVDGFRATCERVMAGQRLPAAVRYGLSQAVLQAAAHVRRLTPAEVICSEYSLPVRPKPVPLFAQSGDLRRDNTDKMILKRVDALPHGLINSAAKFGPRGEAFLDYAEWVAGRVRDLGDPQYRPILHFDLYGTAGRAFANDLRAIAGLLASAQERVGAFTLQIETPFILGSREQQIEGFAQLKALLEQMGSPVRLVADEWCDTLADVREFAARRAAHLVQIKMPDLGSLTECVEAVLAAKAAGIGAYLGGSCAETDLSARLAAHVGVATQVDLLLAKPGMGVDEGITIVGNEQSRLIAVLSARAQALAAA
jgi:methylaspartate ammonia-lyase